MATPSDRYFLRLSFRIRRGGPFWRAIPACTFDLDDDTRDLIKTGVNSRDHLSGGMMLVLQPSYHSITSPCPITIVALIAPEIPKPVRRLYCSILYAASAARGACRSHKFLAIPHVVLIGMAPMKSRLPISTPQ